MALNLINLDQDAFSCSVCLDLLKDAATIPCGHSYCMNCIKSHWDAEQQQKKGFSCPQCRKSFRQRPALEKNVIIAALVEGMKKVKLQAAPADLCYAGAEDVACDVCTDRKLKAIKSCLLCGASYCEKHIQPHYNAPPLKKHKLIHPSKKVQDHIGSAHDEVMQILTNEYKSAAAAERSEKQKELEASRQQIQQRIQDGEKDVKLLQQEVEAINVSADKAVEDSEKIFTELIRLLQKRSSDVKQQIRSQQETEVSRVKELQEKLEQEITELKRKDGELEQLSHTEDHSHFLDRFSTLAAAGDAPRPPGVTIQPRSYFENLTSAVMAAGSKLRGVLTGTWSSSAVIPDHFPPRSDQPSSRTDFLRYARKITLDPNTVNPHMQLAEGNRRVTLRVQRQPYPRHPDRCISHFQALSRESLTGRCYWEVEWDGDGVSLAVSYRRIVKSWGSERGRFGFNDHSWALFFDSSNCCFWHREKDTALAVPRSTRIGVYLDYGAGILSFYSVSPVMTLLHSVQTKFTEPLHAGVWLIYGNDSAEFVKMK